MMLALIPAIVVFLLLRGAGQVYTDLVSGFLAGRDESKLADLVFFPVFIVSGHLFYFILSKRAEHGILQGLFHKLDLTWSALRFYCDERKQVLTRLLTSIVFFLATFQIFSTKIPPQFQYFLLNLSVLIVLYVFAFTRKEKWKEDAKTETILQIVLLNVFSYLALQGVLGFFIPYVLGDVFWRPAYLQAVMLLVMSLGNALLIGLIYWAQFPKVRLEVMKKGVQWVQFLIPLNMMLFLQFTVKGSEGIYVYPVRSWVVVCLWLFIGLSVLCNAKDFSKKKNIFLFTALTIGAILTPTFQHYPMLIPSGDYFHLGELMNPYTQFLKWGQQYYQDYMPTMGLMGIYQGAINDWVYGGQVVTFGLARDFGQLIFVLLITGFVCNSVGPLAALLIAVSASCLEPRYYLMPLIFLLLMTQTLKARPRIWLISYLLLFAVYYSWHLPIAFALSMAFIPQVFMQVQTLRKQSSSSAFLLSCALLFLLSASLLLFFPPLRSMVLFFRDAGAGSNMNAYGNAMALFKSQALFARALIGMVCAISVYTGLFILSKLSNQSEKSLFSSEIARLGCWAFLFLIPYFMGAFGVYVIYRILFCMSILFIYFFSIALFKHRAHYEKRTFLILFPCLIFVTVFMLWPSRQGFWQIPRKISVNGEWFSPQWKWARAWGRNVEFIDGPLLGLPEIGSGYALKTAKEELERLKELTDIYVKPGEAFFDFTDSPAYYQLLDKAIPVPHEAPFSAPVEKMQERLVLALRKSPPSFILTQTDLTKVFAISLKDTHLVWNPAIRCYRVFKHLLLSGYEPMQAPGIHYLLRPDKVQEPSSRKERADKIHLVFGPNDLEMLPNAWGRNFARLRNRFERIKDVSLEQGHEEMVLNLPINGGEADFLYFRLKKDLPKARTFQLSWKGQDELFSGKMKFSLKNTSALVPLGMDARWLLNESVVSVSILEDEKALSLDDFLEIQFLKLVK